MSDDRGTGGPRTASGPPLPCGEVRDLLPLRHVGGLASSHAREVEAHLGTCADCRDEDRFVARLHAARVEPPPALAAAVASRLAGESPQEDAEERPPRHGVASWERPRERKGSRHPAGWGLAAAAGIVLALGIGVVWSSRPDPGREALLQTLVESPEEQGVEDWMVAGAPVWDALPDEVLQGLMAEEDA